MRSTLTDPDVLPSVYLFLRGQNFTSRARNKYFHSKLRKPSYAKIYLHGLYLILHKSISCGFNLFSKFSEFFDVQSDVT